MPSKPRKAKPATWMDIFKSKRGEPIPPNRIVPVQDRPSPTAQDWDEEDAEALVVCGFCGVQRDPSWFREGGLRCDECREEDEEMDDYLRLVDELWGEDA